MTAASPRPPQWRYGRPAWWFDGWGVARGGHDVRWLPSPATPVERRVVRSGFVLFWAFMLGAYFTQIWSLALVSLILVAPATVVARRILRNRAGEP